MTYCAASVRNPSPNRQARAGAIRLDMVVMILVIVAMIGLSVWAFMIHAKWSEDQTIVTRLEGYSEIPLAEAKTTRSYAENATRMIGFRGDGGFPSLARIEGALKSLVADKSTVYFDPSEDMSVNAAGQVIGMTVRPVEMSNDSITNLVAQLDWQDDRINEIARAIETWRKVKASEEAKLETSRAAYVARLKKFIEEDTKPFVARLDTRLKDQFTALAAAVNAEADKVSDVVRALDSADTAVAGGRTQLLTELARIGPAADEARLNMEEAVNAVSRRSRALASAGGFDGYVAKFDPASKYVWISIGQNKGVKREMTFQVFTPTPDNSGSVLIAEIRVKEVDADSARCRIDFLKDSNVFPQVGDFIQNPNFAKHPYTMYYLAGDFGGRSSTYSKQQLIELLESVGHKVQGTPTAATEVVIIAGDYRSDPGFQQLEAGGVRFITMTEREILYMFGISGTD